MMTIVAFVLSFYEIFVKEVNAQKVDLEIESQDQKVKTLDLHRSTGNVRFHMGDLFFLRTFSCTTAYIITGM